MRGGVVCVHSSTAEGSAASGATECVNNVSRHP